MAKSRRYRLSDRKITPEGNRQLREQLAALKVRLEAERAAERPGFGARNLEVLTRDQ